MTEPRFSPTPPPPAPGRGELQCRTDGTLVSGSDGLAHLLGYEGWAHLAARVQNLRELLADPLDRERLDEGIHQVLAGDEARWLREDGTSIWFLSDVKLLEWSATGDDLIEVAVEDVTEQRRLEDQLRQGQKMELLGQLTGGVVHDFNNILATVLTLSELLGEAIRDNRTPDALDELDHLRRCAERGSQMVRHLLVFSRPEDLERNPISLNHAVRNTTNVLRRLLPQTIQVDLEEEAELVAIADPGALEQILLNLATNARDAMPRGGRLEIRLTRAVLDRRHLNQHGWGQPGEYASIIMTDTGAGMAPEVMSRVFEPFFTTKEKGKGTGLGLPMVYGLMKQHRGFVEVTAGPEGGTRVCLFFRPAPEMTPTADLPLTEVARGPASRTPSVPGTGRGDSAVEGGSSGSDASPGEREPDEGVEILLVEDDEALRTVMARSLERVGYRVLTAGDGHEALDLLDEGRNPALIISDVIMPGMGGVELQRILSSSGDAPPMLLTSGLDRSRAFQGGPIPDEIPFLQKPWTIQRLQDRVAEALAGTARGD